MIVWNGIEAVPAGTGTVVASIGNFDGLHLGHRSILDSAVRDARRRRLPLLVLTFDPHPLSVVAPGRNPSLLLTRRQKLDALEAAGVDVVLVLAFDADLAAHDAEEFFAGYLADRVRFSAVHVGRNFRFGRGRDGDLAALEHIGSTRGFDVIGVPDVTVDGETVSSTAIRSALRDGEVERARRFLGRPYSVTGRVVPGDGRGRLLTFPTANVDVENETVPRRGVYVTETIARAARWPSVTNLGVRPTFGASRPTVETHLLDFDEGLYGERIEVCFHARLRDERRFAGPAELADQIGRDRAAAASYFRGVALSPR